MILHFVNFQWGEQHLGVHVLSHAVSERDINSNQQVAFHSVTLDANAHLKNAIEVLAQDQVVRKLECFTAIPSIVLSYFIFMLYCIFFETIYEWNGILRSPKTIELAVFVSFLIR